MLDIAQSHINPANVREIKHTSFQSLLKTRELKEADFIVSSLAIHHLTKGEKRDLYGLAYQALRKGGMFLNYDVVLSPTKKREKANLRLWENWIQETEWPNQVDKADSLTHIPAQYKNAGDNIPDTLDCQLDMLKSAGYVDIDVFYKFGIFSLFGGEKA